MNNQKAQGSAISICMVLVLSACTAVHPPSGYLGDYSHFSEKEKGEVFRQEYLPVKVEDFEKYEKVKVAPVELKYFSSPKEKITDEQLEQLSIKMKASLEKGLAKKYQVLTNGERPDSKTLVVEPALIQVTTPKRLLNLATFWFIGWTFSKGSAALEARLTDGATGKELGIVAERRKSGGGITDIKSIFLGGWLEYVSAEGIFKRWGKNFVKLTTPEIA